MTWELRSLSDLGQWFGGSTPSKRESRFWHDGTTPWLSPKDMGEPVLAGTRDHITSYAVSEGRARVVPPGSLAIVVRSGILERTVPIAVVPFETALNQDMKALSPSRDVDVRWVAWALRSQERHILSDDRKAGTTVASLDSHRLLSRRIPLPSLPEQRRIVDILEDRLSRLDIAEEGLRRSASRAKLIPEAVWSTTDLQEAPRLPLEELLSEPMVNGRSVRTQEGGFPVLRLTALGRSELDLSARKGGMWSRSDAARFIVEEGDFLVSRGNGSRSRVARGARASNVVNEVAFPDTMIRIRTDSARICDDFFAAVWGSQSVRKQIEAAARTTAGIYKVNQSDLRRISIPVPDRTSQMSRIQRMRTAEDASQRLAQAIGRAQTRSAGLHEALLSAAFSGQLTGHASDTDRIEEMADASFHAS